MIGFLRGKLISKQPPHLLLEVQGVGYELEAPMSTFYHLADNENAEIQLYTHLVVREDAHVLYAFVTLRERAVFRTLIKINGVGAKLALSILSAMDIDSFAQCIHQKQVNTLVRIPGVGKKTAERLIVELDAFAVDNSNIKTLPNNNLTQGVTTTVEDAISALIALGYKAQDAARLVNQVKTTQAQSSEVLIRLALQQAI
jgi:holliday junction DNA helicase RuvA